MGSLRWYCVFLLSLVLCSSAFGQAYSLYCNGRYGFCINIPMGLKPGPQPQNGDGQGFRNRNGFRVLVLGSNNIFGETLRTKIDKASKDFSRLTYRSTGPNWFILSGFKGQKILYIKTYLGKGSLNTLYIEYPSSLKIRYDEDVTILSKTFKPGNLAEPR